MKKLHDLEIEDFLHECVEVDPLLLDDEFARMPADMAYWAARYAESIKRFLHAEHARKKVQASVWIEERAQGGTIDDVKSRVALSSAHIEATLEEIDAEAEKERLRGVVEAIRTKRDMLIASKIGRAHV